MDAHMDPHTEKPIAICPLHLSGGCIIIAFNTDIKTLSSRVMYRIAIYQLYWYFGYMIHIISFIFVTRYFKRYIFASILDILVFTISKFLWNLWIDQVFGSKTRQNVSLIHIEYCFLSIMICNVSLKINDREPYYHLYLLFHANHCFQLSVILLQTIVFCPYDYLWISYL